MLYIYTLTYSDILSGIFSGIYSDILSGCNPRHPACHMELAGDEEEKGGVVFLGILTWQVGKKMDGVLWCAELGESLHCLDTF